MHGHFLTRSLTFSSSHTWFIRMDRCLLLCMVASTCPTRAWILSLCVCLTLRVMTMLGYKRCISYMAFASMFGSFHYLWLSAHASHKVLCACVVDMGHVCSVNVNDSPWVAWARVKKKARYRGFLCHPLDRDLLLWTCLGCVCMHVFALYLTSAVRWTCCFTLQGEWERMQFYGHVDKQNVAVYHGRVCLGKKQAFQTPWSPRHKELQQEQMHNHDGEWARIGALLTSSRMHPIELQPSPPLEASRNPLPTPLLYAPILLGSPSP